MRDILLNFRIVSFYFLHVPALHPPPHPGYLIACVGFRSRVSSSEVADYRCFCGRGIVDFFDILMEVMDPFS